jgi:catechol-2,3-dioxygenase
VHTVQARGAAQPGLHHMAWQLGCYGGLRAAYQELKAMAVPIDSTVEHNVTRSIHFHDPDGNRAELYGDMVDDGFEGMRTVGPGRDPLNLESRLFVQPYNRKDQRWRASA